ncbi:MAG: hypothetical protein ACLQEQ_03505 [Nitrososphaerales archaeon]
MHRELAPALFNDVWRLLALKRRTKEEDEQMVNEAHASLYHWSKVGTAKQRAIGEWQVSHVYAVLGRKEPALHHANRSLEICLKKGINDFPLAYAYEALARAYAVANDRRKFETYVRLAEGARESIREDADRRQFERDLGALSKLRPRA